MPVKVFERMGVRVLPVEEEVIHNPGRPVDGGISREWGCRLKDLLRLLRLRLFGSGNLCVCSASSLQMEEFMK